MPLLDSEAVILRTRPLSEADKWVSFLSRRLGRLRGVAPNARRSRRRFGAALEPLSHVRLWFFERPGHELVRLSESELIAAYWDARGDYERSLALNQIAELSELLLPEREPSDKAFRLLLMTLGALQASDNIWLPLTYFQLWMVRLAGWLPALDSCAQCGKSLEQGPAYASPALGRVACSGCRQPGMRLLSAPGRAAAGEMLEHPLARISWEGWDRQRAAELQNYLLDVIEAHSERKLITRELQHEKA
ncbi:MAG TPA: DNA repair protein RecO [Candidatus Xenobia bacterium]|nr:DNA repair protein RecO [Candidatus Xenobia bacterium]